METFDPAPNSPPLAEVTLRRLLAVDLDSHFGLFVRAYQQEVRMIVRQLTNMHQPDQGAIADDLAEEIFIQMYRDLKNFKAEEVLKLLLWARLYRITVDRCFGRLVNKCEPQIYSSVQQLLVTSKSEQSKAVTALARTIFAQIQQELKNCDAVAIQTEEVWVWLYNSIIAHCFEQLLETYRPQLEAFVLSLSGNVDNVQDIVQEALLNAFKHLKAHGIPYKDTFDPKGWIFKIAKHAFLRSLRKIHPLGKEISIDNVSEDHPVFEVVDDRNIPPDVALELAESHRSMEDLIDKLPEKYREIIHLRFLDDWSNAQIAAKLTLKEVTVRTYIHRGTKLLRTLLNEGQERKVKS